MTENYTDTGIEEAPSPELDCHALGAQLNLYDTDGRIQFDANRAAARQYFLQHVDQNAVFFHDLEGKLKYLVDEGYYEKYVLDQYDFAGIKELYKQAYAYKFHFPAFLGAFKYYTSYTLKTFDDRCYLECFEDRVAMVSLYLARGDTELARSFVDKVMTGRFQPATPTFLNAGKAARGGLISCFLLRIEGNMESIACGINSALQLSKCGGGVALQLTNLRESGASIKKIQNQSSGVVPVTKLLEDSFSYANQLGARQGAGTVYLHAHHPDIMQFLDTKRGSTDEKIRIKTLSLDVVIPGITFELACKNEDMYLFSPYDVERMCGVPFSKTSVAEKYHEMVDDSRIHKRKINVRRFFQTIAGIQFESGYPYIVFEDTVNKINPIKDRITMLNLCSEILQVSEVSTYSDDLSYDHVGKDISCNLGSLNIVKTMDSPDFLKTIEMAIRGLTAVSDLSDIGSVPSVTRGNAMSHAISLDQMDLHGYLACEHVHYGSEEALDFTNMYFMTVLFEAIRAPCKIARECGETFKGFEESKYASGEFFCKYIDEGWAPTTDKCRELLTASSIKVPTQADWEALAVDVARYGMYNQNLQAVPPTSSISYINNLTSSIHPIISHVGVRKEGKIGRAYYSVPCMSNENLEYYRDAYEIGPEKIIDTYAVATQHVGQGLSLTLFYPDTVTTYDLNKSYIYAWKKGIKTLYYMRLRQMALGGTGVEGYVSCML